MEGSPLELHILFLRPAGAGAVAGAVAALLKYIHTVCLVYNHS